MNFLYPQWEAPAQVKALVTTRVGGVSAGAFASFDLALHAGGDREAVATNRKILLQGAHLPQAPLWLNQVHGTVIVEDSPGLRGQIEPPQADGALSSLPQSPLAIMTADCLPVLVCDKKGTRIGAFHAGWKGLAAGILEKGIEGMGGRPEDLQVWLGPSISGQVYQIGEEVRQVFFDLDPENERFFQPDGQHKWLFDFPGCAEALVRKTGVQNITRSPWCTYSHPDLFYSYRREHPCGRMASLIWIEP